MSVNSGTILVSNQDLSYVNGEYSRNILFVGIKNTSGTAESFELKQNIISQSKINEFFGRSSHIAQGLRYAVNFANKNNFSDNKLNISGLGINQIGVKGVANILFNGTATETIITQFYVGDSKTPKEITITSGQTASQIVSALVSYLNTDLDLFFISAIDGSEVKKINLTASVEGTWVNNVKIKVVNLPAGITTTITQFTGGLNTGLTNLTALKTAIENKQFHSIVIEKDLFDLDNSLQTFFDDRSIYLRNINLMGQVIFANINTTEANIVNNYDDNQWGICIARKASYTLPYLLLADFVTIKEGRLVEFFRTNNISSAIQNGGVRHANLPINEIRLNTINEIQSDEQFTNDELISLNAKGFLTIESNENNLAILTGNKSMYVKDVNGNEVLLSRITDYEKKTIVSNELFNAVKIIKNKSLVVAIVNQEHDITKPQTSSLLKKVFEDCRGVKEVLRNGISIKTNFGIVSNDPAVITIIDSVIDNAVDKLVPSRTINLNSLSILNIIIENVGLTNLFSN